METLKEKTARGLFWGGMNNLVMQLIGAIFGFAMARLLDNADYGMMAGIVVFTLTIGRDKVRPTKGKLQSLFI